MRETLSRAEAARVLLTSQGFGRRQPVPPGMRQVQQVIDRLAQFQIDSVNVVMRAHYLPLFSRLGGYDTALLDRAAGRGPRRVFEYWGHAASLIDVRLQPALRHRMASAEQDAWGGIRRVRAEHPDLVEAVWQEVAEGGPLTAREVEARIEAPARGIPTEWGWNWSATKRALEWHFWSGTLTAASRNEAFERRYDLPERVLPRAIVDSPTPDIAAAHRMLACRAAAALGVVTADWAAEYFRLAKQPTRIALHELAEDGLLTPVRIDQVAAPAWLWHQARLPRRVTAQALICPFDPLLFDRRRLRALFGADYSIEIYVPAAKRRFGYYVYCLLAAEQVAARVDLKADRQAGVLRVQSAWAEPGHRWPAGQLLDALVSELTRMAQWLGLSEVCAEPVGDLGADLVRRLGHRQ